MKLSLISKILEVDYYIDGSGILEIVFANSKSYISKSTNVSERSLT